MKKLYVLLLIVVSLPAFAIQNKSLQLISQKDGYTLEVTYPYLKNNTGFNQAVMMFIYSLKKEIKTQAMPNPKALANGTLWKVTYEVMNHTKDQISIRFMVVMDNIMAAHPNMTYKALNYNLAQKQLETLQAVLMKNHLTLKNISQQCEKQLLQHLKITKKDSFTGDLIREGTKPEAANYMIWNKITSPKPMLVFSFPTYQVAAYALGPQKCIITLSGNYIRHGTNP